VFPSLALRLVEARLQVVHVAVSRRLCHDKVKDRQVDAMDCVRPFYPKIDVFYVLDPRGVLLF
jgi:murein endopeptidase